MAEAAGSTKDYMVGHFPESLEQRVNIVADVSVSDIAQRYRMQQVLGSGAQATVYQAVSKKTQRKVAVKVRRRNPARRSRHRPLVAVGAFSRDYDMSPITSGVFTRN